jgi:hypothetical protein
MRVYTHTHTKAINATPVCPPPIPLNTHSASTRYTAMVPGRVVTRNDTGRLVHECRAHGHLPNDIQVVQPHLTAPCAYTYAYTGTCAYACSCATLHLRKVAQGALARKTACTALRQQTAGAHGPGLCAHCACTQTVWALCMHVQMAAQICNHALHGCGWMRRRVPRVS